MRYGSCLIYQVSILPNGIVKDASTAPDPACDVPDRRRWYRGTAEVERETGLGDPFAPFVDSRRSAIGRSRQPLLPSSDELGLAANGGVADASNRRSRP